MNRQAIACVALLATLPALAAHAAEDEILVTATRLGAGLPATATTVIDEEAIRRSPARSVPEVLSQQAGVQVRDLHGGLLGAQSTVDLRGFGASARQNTLVLLNGRRINDLDQSQINWAAIPLDNVRRIEVMRGSAGSVLYGDGAVGGVVNIVTKGPVARTATGTVAAGLGSFHSRTLDAQGQTGEHAGFLASASGRIATSDGYRDNNEFVQRSLAGELRHEGDGDSFLRFSADNQSLELPGVRRIFATGISELTGSRRAADTPFDQAWQQNVNLALGHTRDVADGVELTLDGGVRRKTQQAVFISAFGAAFNSYVDTAMTTWSLTPRASIGWSPFGLSAQTRAGVDLYYVDYTSDRKQSRDATPIHIYNGWQTNAAMYQQSEVRLGAGTQATFGARLERAHFVAGDIFNVNAPGGAGGARDLTLATSDTLWALNLGLEQDLAEGLAGFVRVGRSYRTPNIDERIGASGTSLSLQSQRSYDVETGVKAAAGPVRLLSSLYYIRLRNELHFDPNMNFGTNTNLDPTRRFGWDNSVSWQALPDLRLTGAASYTKAEFTSGRYRGNDVPLVAPWVFSLSSLWDILPNLTLSGSISYVADRRLDNDQANFQPHIPSYWTADLKISGKYGPVDWSAQVNNIFEQEYFTYGVASATTQGRYNAYPLPERTFFVRAGMTF